LTGFPKIETSSARVRLTEVTPASINVEVVCYVLTRDFDEYATVREDLLLRIMNFVEDSGTNLATPSQTLYLSGDPKLPVDKNPPK
jgi:MscS family membrane protein